MLTSVYGIKIDGIIGYSFFKKYIVAINYDSLVVNVYTPGLFLYPKRGHVLKPLFSTIPIQAAVVKDARQITENFFLDTGAGVCMVINDAFATDSALMAPNKKYYNAIAEGLGGKAMMRYTVLKQLKVGPYKFKRVPVYLFADIVNVTRYPETGGLLGNDIMRRFNVIINYPNHEVFIKPNNAYLEAFDYAYTGMSIYIVNSKIEIGDVIAESPAFIAGLQTGDIIISVEGLFNNDIQAYKHLLQKANTTLHLIISRQGELHEIKLKTKSIL